MGDDESARPGLIAGLNPAPLRAAVAGDPFWAPALEQALRPGGAPTVLHLAILVEPFLGQILAGRKTIESRFGRRRQAPFGRVAVGDLMLLKRSGGPLLGLAAVAQVQDLALSPNGLAQLRERYAAALCAEDAAFWEARAGSAYATLLWLAHVRSVMPILLPRRDRRGWVVLTHRAEVQP